MPHSSGNRIGEIAHPASMVLERGEGRCDRDNGNDSPRQRPRAPDRDTISQARARNFQDAGERLRSGVETGLRQR